MASVPMTSRRRPINVAHVTGERGFSGGEVQVFLLMEGLRKRGHHNVLLCPPGSRCASEAQRRGIQTRAIRTRNEWSPRALLGVRRALQLVSPDLVHLHTGHANWLGGLSAWQLGIPAITTRRMDRAVKRNLRTRFLYGVAVQRAAAISHAVEQRLVEGRVPPEMIRVIPSAVDPALLFPQSGRAATRAGLGLGPDAPCLLVLASLVHRKGIDVLLEALSKLAEEGLRPALWIGGEGPTRGLLERLARQRRIDSQVRFLGQRSDVADLLVACDVFVLPSRQEGLGVAALEAMALGRPVVATRVGGLGEAVLDEQTGLLVPPGDATALKQAIAGLLRDPALRQRLGAAGPRRIEQRFRAEAMVDAYERLYFEVLDEQRPP
jgi:glycosyltransferase involved in cell wall biosynthesis